jgi:hypothetical protein
MRLRNYAHGCQEAGECDNFDKLGLRGGRNDDNGEDAYHERQNDECSFEHDSPLMLAPSGEHIPALAVSTWHTLNLDGSLKLGIAMAGAQPGPNLVHGDVGWAGFETTPNGRAQIRNL